MAAPPVAVHDPPSDLVGASEEPGGLGHVTIGQQVPDPGRGVHHPVAGDEFQADDVEAELRTQAPQQLDIASAVAAEVEVGPDDDEPGPETANQHLAHKLLG